MNNKILWNKIILDEFIKLGMLTDLEEHILRLRIAGYQIEEIAFRTNMSRSSINNYIKLLKQKYDAVQPYSEILPPRYKKRDVH